MLAVNSFSQDEEYCGIKLEIGPRFANYNPDAFNTYLSTYNEYMEGIGVNPVQGYTALKSFSPGFGIGGTIHYTRHDGPYFGLHFSRSNHKQTSSYIRTDYNAYGREFIYKSLYSQFLLESGYCNEDESFIIGGGLGILNNNNRVEVWQIYADGSRSLGPELYTNGYYKAVISRMSFSGFMEFNLYKSIVKLNIRGIYQWDFVDAITKEDNYFIFEDLSDSKHPIFSYLPRDYKEFVSNVEAGNFNTNQAHTNGVTTSKFLNFNLAVSLIINIPAIREK